MNSDTGPNQEKTDGTGERSIGPPFFGVPPDLETYRSDTTCDKITTRFVTYELAGVARKSSLTPFPARRERLASKPRKLELHRHFARLLVYMDHFVTVRLGTQLLSRGHFQKTTDKLQA